MCISDLCYIIATLKNDDAEDSDTDGEGDELLAKESKLQSETSKRVVAAAEKQPTGRIVGIIKRNWRT